MIPNIVFYITAFITIISAIMVITTKDIFRAALFLASTFMGVVGLFILLFAEFLAAVQLIIYVGAISVVILFAIMFTKDVEVGNPFSKYKIVGIVICLILLILLILSIANYEWNYNFEIDNPNILIDAYKNSIYYIGKTLVTTLVVPFIASSFVLLAAVLGAISLVKERES
jgi:NADH-quinone oxidoreductase subunit J